MGHERGRNYKMLAVVLVLAAGYVGWMITQRTITDISRLDGILGVLLGLFICSRPAANYLDLLFTRNRSSSERSLLGWLILNGAVLFAGWFVITIGATRLIGK
jgi:TctA family transporter